MAEEKNKPLDPVYAIKFQYDASIATCEGLVEQMGALGTKIEYQFFYLRKKFRNKTF